MVSAAGAGMTVDAILGVFAKWPEPGKVKTRLAASLGTEPAARIAMAFLRDVLERLRPVSANRYLLYTPAEAQGHFASLETDYMLEPQSSGDLGQRLASFFRWAFGQGAQRVIAMGTDSPTLPLSFVHQALEGLSHSDVVIGPATDGGYYLLGCREWLPDLFDAIEWSTAGVMAQTVQRAQACGCALSLLPPWYDVDTPEEWQMLQGHLLAMRAANLDPGLPCTEALIREGV